jgi:hypothetical protein
LFVFAFHCFAEVIGGNDCWMFEFVVATLAYAIISPIVFTSASCWTTIE